MLFNKYCLFILTVFLSFNCKEKKILADEVKASNEIKQISVKAARPPVHFSLGDRMRLFSMLNYAISDTYWIDFKNGDVGLQLGYTPQIMQDKRAVDSLFKALENQIELIYYCVFADSNFLFKKILFNLIDPFRPNYGVYRSFKITGKHPDTTVERKLQLFGFAVLNSTGRVDFIGKKIIFNRDITFNNYPGYEFLKELSERYARAAYVFFLNHSDQYDGVTFTYNYTDIDGTKKSTDFSYDYDDELFQLLPYYLQELGKHAPGQPHYLD